MPESETEDQILDRIEDALRKIAGATASRAAALPVPALVSAPEPEPVKGDDALDREALASALEIVIARLRGALPSQHSPTTE